MLKAVWDYNTRLSPWSLGETCEDLYVKMYELGNVVEKRHGKRPDTIRFGYVIFATRFTEILERWDQESPRYFKPEHDAALKSNQVQMFLDGECVVDLSICNFDESF